MYTLSSLAAHAYITAALVYLAFLVRQWPPLATAGRLLVGAGLALHAVSLGVLLGAQGGAPAGLAQGFSILAFLLLAIFLALDLRYRRPVLGAFVTPLARGGDAAGDAAARRWRRCRPRCTGRCCPCT